MINTNTSNGKSQASFFTRVLKTKEPRKLSLVETRKAKLEEDKQLRKLALERGEISKAENKRLQASEKIELQKIEYLEKEELKKLKKQFAASPFSSVFGDISLQLRRFGEKHGWKAYSIYFLTLMSCLFHITSFNTLLVVYDSSMFLLFRYMISIGLSMTLEFSFIFFKYKRNLLMTSILFLTSFVILFYSAFYQVWIDRNYFDFDSYASSKDMIRFILGNSFFFGLLAFVHIVSPRKRGKKVTYAKLSRKLKQSLNDLVDNCSKENPLDFKETSIGWNILESELRKLIIRKGKWSNDFVVNNNTRKGKK